LSDQTLAEVDLQLSARWRLEPRRRQRLSLQRLTIGPHGALQRPPARSEPLPVPRALVKEGLSRSRGLVRDRRYRGSVCRTLGRRPDG
jgi:hypothetical protein